MCAKSERNQAHAGCVVSDRLLATTRPPAGRRRPRCVYDTTQLYGLGAYCEDADGRECARHANLDTSDTLRAVVHAVRGCLCGKSHGEVSRNHRLTNCDTSFVLFLRPDLTRYVPVIALQHRPMRQAARQRDSHIAQLQGGHAQRPHAIDDRQVGCHQADVRRAACCRRHGKKIS
jgi:hypothetical protein